MKDAGPVWRASFCVALAALGAACEGGGTEGPVATSMEAASPTQQVALPGAPVPDVPTVRVMDQSGAAMAGVPVTFTVTSGGGSVGTTTATTNNLGQASAVSWTLGPSAGVNTLTATVAGLPPVVFGATALNPCLERIAYTLFTAIQGSLALSDCRVEGGYYVDIYTTTLPAAQGVEFRMNSSQLDAWLEVYDSQGNLVAGNDDDMGTNATARVFAAAGSYFLAATSAGSGEVGAYQLSSATFTDNANCREYWLVPGVVVTGTLAASDCDFGAAATDEYLVVLQAGQSITVRMESSQVDPLLEIYNLSNARVASDDDSGGGTTALLTYTAPSTSLYFLDATAFAAGETGAYTLTVTRN